MPSPEKLHAPDQRHETPAPAPDPIAPQQAEFVPELSVRGAVAPGLGIGAAAGAAALRRSVIRREDTPGIGAPTGVKARRGDKSFAVTPVTRPPGTDGPPPGVSDPREPQPVGPRGDGPLSGAPDPREPLPGGSGTGPGADDASSPTYRLSTEKQLDDDDSGPTGHHVQAPTVAAVPIPGVDPKQDSEHPYQAVVGYEKYAGKLLQDAQRHDQRIETYARFVEADHVRLAKLHADYLQLGDGSKNAKKRKELEDKLGAKKLPADAREAVWAVAFDIAEERSRLAQVARLNANQDVPMIDGVYEQARDAKKQVFEQTGGRAPAHTEARKQSKYLEYVAEHEKGSKAVANGKQRKEPAKLAASLSKHKKRSRLTGDAIATATAVGLAVREAKLSEGRLFVKVSELDHHKKSIEDAVSAGDWLKDKAKFVGKKVAGVGFGMVTAGLGAAEDVGSDGDEALGMKTTWLWNRLEGDFQKIVALDEKQPYGKATSFHMGLQFYNAVLREVRNVIAGLAMLCGILGAAVAVFAPPVAVVMKAIGVALGLIALGLTAVKVVIDTVLATWTGIQRAATSNARNKNMLNAQGRSQAGELLTDAVSIGATFGAPAVANAGELGKHGSSHFLSPLQQPTGSGFAASVAQPGGSTWANVGQIAATKGVPMASGIGVKSLNQGAIADEMATEQGKHKATARPNAPAPRQAPGPAPARGQEPAWLKAARTSEQSTLEGSIGQLITKHSRERAAFHDKTQAMMKHFASIGADSEKASGKLAAAKKKDEDGTLSLAKGMAAEFGAVTQRMGKAAATLSPADVREAVVGADG